MLPEIETLDQAALDQFIVDLVDAGFEPVEGFGRYVWRGPIDPSLADLTAETRMLIWLEPGWPFIQPHVHVGGLRPSVHLQGGALCLWQRGDESMAWLRLADVRARLGEWADRYRGAATTEDPNLDPDAYWTARDIVMATVDLGDIPWGDGGSGLLRATLEEPRRVLRIGNEGPLRVRWYGRRDLTQIPVNLDMLGNTLRPEQRANLQRELESVGEPNGLDVLMLVWGTPVGEPNILVLRLGRDERTGDVVSKACEVARTDEHVLLLRAGPDAPALRTKSITVFGAGAIGSHLTSLLARSGAGRIRSVDGQKIRPGDVVRHAAPSSTVGVEKPFAVRLAVSQFAPWTTIEYVIESPWDPARIRELCNGVDLVIDATGAVTFPDQLGRILADAGTPMLSVALYRNGDVARARLVPVAGLPLHERREPTFRTIPPSPAAPEPAWETGCGAPVNNAPPASVASAAALAARQAIEMLTGRAMEAADIVEVYRPIEAPFDLIGTQRFAP